MNLTYVKTELMQRNNFNSKDPFTQRGCVCVCVKLQHCVYGMLRQTQRMGIEPIICVRVKLQKEMHSVNGPYDKRPIPFYRSFDANNVLFFLKRSSMTLMTLMCLFHNTSNDVSFSCLIIYTNSILFINTWTMLDTSNVIL